MISITSSLDGNLCLWKILLSIGDALNKLNEAQWKLRKMSRTRWSSERVHLHLLISWYTAGVGFIVRVLLENRYIEFDTWKNTGDSNTTMCLMSSLALDVSNKRTLNSESFLIWSNSFSCALIALANKALRDTRLSIVVIL